MILRVTYERNERTVGEITLPVLDGGNQIRCGSRRPVNAKTEVRALCCFHFRSDQFGSGALVRPAVESDRLSMELV